MAEQQFVHQQAFSTSVFQFAEAQQIGTVVKEYKSQTLMKSILGICLNVLGGIFILGGVGLAALVHTLDSIRAGLFLAAVGLVALSYGLYLTRTVSRNKRTQIYVGTDGLMRVKGDQVETIRWDQISGVQQRFVQSRSNYFLRAYLLLRRDGSVLAIERSYQDFKELGKAIEDEVTRHLLPEALAVYQTGGAVSFGAMQVSSQGISVQKQNELKTLLWSEFNGYKVYDGRVNIKKRAGRLAWETLLISQVPNLCVLLALTQHITNEPTPAEHSNENDISIGHDKANGKAIK